MIFRSVASAIVLALACLNPSDAVAQTTLAGPTTAPTITNPDPTSTARDASNDPARYSGFVEYLTNRLAPYEPMYFVAGTEAPNVKFQVSLRYQLFNDDGPAARAFGPLKGLNFAYAQTSFWDTSAESAPFIDNSYRPEILLHYDDVVEPAKLRFLEHVGLQTGVQHESNGQAGDDSRSMNFVYVRPLFTVGERDDGGLFVTLAPRLHAYIGSMENNDDIADYRGYGDLRVIVGQGGGLQAAFIGRIGNEFDKGSVQMDLSFPLRKVLAGNVDLYLNLQVFNGYGESLINYDESDTSVRLGVALVR